MRIVTNLVRRAGDWVCRGGGKGQLSILIYHRVFRQPDALFPEEVDMQAFLWQMRAVKKFFNVLPLGLAVEKLVAKSLPDRALSVTFDDGYADNAEVALPILRELNLPATFFISTQYINGGRMWNDSIIETVRRAKGEWLDLTAMELGKHPLGTSNKKRKAIEALLAQLKYLAPDERLGAVEKIARVAGQELPGDLMLTTRQIKRLVDSGMEIGAHTVSHPILTSLTTTQAQREISEGKETLEELTGHKIKLFAYPNGKPGIDYDYSHVKIVRKLGFSAAVTTSWGVARDGTDIYQLPRFTPWDRSPGRFVFRLFQNCMRKGISVV